MLQRIVSGILAAVFLPLGVTFSIVAGISLGAPLLAAGFVCAVVFLVLRRKELQRRGRRTLRATAEVIEAQINHGVQVNRKRALRLTVRFEPAGTVTGSFLWLPADAIGDCIDVLYDPAEPSNFAPG